MGNNFIDPRVYGGSRNPNVMYGVGPSPQITPETIDTINSVLAPFGLQAPTQVRQNFVLPEAGTDNFFGQHPRLSQGIENALLATATTQSGATVGENIGNVARSVIGIPQMRQQYQLQQLLAPFGVAKQLQDFQKGAADLDLAKAHAEYFRAGGRQISNGIDQWQDDTGMLWRLTPNGALPVTGPDGKQLHGRVPVGDRVGLEEEIIKGKLGPAPGLPGSRYKTPEEYYAAASAELSRIRGANAGAAAGGRISADRSAGGLSDVEQQTITGFDHEISQAQAEIKRLQGLTPLETFRGFDDPNYKGTDKVANASKRKNTEIDRLNSLIRDRKQQRDRILQPTANPMTPPRTRTQPTRKPQVQIDATTGNITIG